MGSFKRHDLQKNGVLNSGISNQWLHLLLFISLVCSSINPALAKCSNQTSKQSNEQISNCNLKTKGQILIFVSFSMPDAALQSYYQEAQLLGGKLVMRGLKNNSFKDTQAKTIELGINFDIDPTLFEEYQVARVPAIVLISDGNAQDNNQLQPYKPKYVKNQDQDQKHERKQLSNITKKITGHVSLAKALEIMEKRI